LQNFEIQFLKEAAKFVGDFKSLANEADASLAKHKALELEIERLLKAVVSQDIMIIVQKESVVDTSDLQIKLEPYKDMQQKIERLQAQLGDLKGKCKDTSSVSDTRNPLSQKLKHKNVEIEFQLFKKVSDQKDNTQDLSANTKFAKQPVVENLPKIGKTNALSKPVTSNSDSTPQESKRVDNTKTRRPQPRSNTKNDRVPSASKSSRSKNKEAEVEEHHRNLLLSKNNKHMSSACNNIKTDSQEVISNATCAMYSKCLISVNHDKCLCYSDLFMVRRFGMFQAYDRKSKASHQFHLEVYGNGSLRNDHVAAILGFGDLQWGNILITRVYFVEGLGHNLFSVGQFCDSDLEVVFRRNACFVRNLEGVDLLKGYCSTNLYTINLHEMASASPICLMARASSTMSWLWHQRLSHLNFDTINDLARNDLVAGLPKFKYHKEHLCPSCEQRKSKRASHPPKPVPNSRQRLHLLHMNLCGPMRIASINGKRYVLVIVDDYSRYTWVHFLRSKDAAPEVIIKFLKRITNGVVERRNRMLVEAARTMLIVSRAPLFLWDEAIATACFTQNRSIIYRRFNKTPYELINGRKPDISFLHVFGALCYPKNDREDIGKLGAKGDIGFFIGYSANSCAYRVYNRQTKKIMETMNVSVDEISAMAFEQRSSKPRLNSMTSGLISSGHDLTYAPSTITTQQPSEGELDFLFEAMYDDYIGGQPSGTARTVRLLKNLKFVSRQRHLQQ
nr:retrovirus-related Pol polyprotein from transposon TNT 1-94 [Tanacetum cinerariifolium]